jgi:hypothetical protein
VSGIHGVCMTWACWDAVVEDCQRLLFFIARDIAPSIDRHYCSNKTDIDSLAIQVTERVTLSNT